MHRRADRRDFRPFMFIITNLDAARRGLVRASSCARAVARWRSLLRTVTLTVTVAVAVAVAGAFVPRLALAQNSQASPATAKPSGMSLIMRGALDVPMSRLGSGTSWLPDSAPMYGVMTRAGSWGIMAHASVFAQYDAQGGTRGSTQVGSINWGMVGASHALAGGRLQLRGMVSLEPFTVGRRGYPLLLQSGETYRGQTIHDRQHPHDLFMELAVVYDRALTSNVALQLYAAPVGEPAVGPVAFPHRPSASAQPFATVAHHWQDATHVSFGVTTAALYTRTVKLEASLFNGREPDDVRTNFDYAHATLDAVAFRATVNPDAFTSISASAARIPDAESAHPGEAIRRVTASLLRSRTGPSGRLASLAIIAGANSVGAAHFTPAFTAEVQHDVWSRTALFLRAEVAKKSGEELVTNTDTLIHLAVAADEHAPEYVVSAFTIGAIRELASGHAGALSVGAQGTLNLVPETLRAFYGSRTPLGAAVYLRWRPGRMSMATMHDMPGMNGMHEGSVTR
jgi:hypothetical protein